MGAGFKGLLTGLAKLGTSRLTTHDMSSSCAARPGLAFNTQAPSLRPEGFHHLAKKIEPTAHVDQVEVSFIQIQILQCVKEVGAIHHELAGQVQNREVALAKTKTNTQATRRSILKDDDPSLRNAAKALDICLHCLLCFGIALGLVIAPFHERRTWLGTVHLIALAKLALAIFIVLAKLAFAIFIVLARLALAICIAHDLAIKIDLLLLWADNLVAV